MIDFTELWSILVKERAVQNKIRSNRNLLDVIFTDESISYYLMKKILIAGAGGYIGTELVAYLLKKGHFVIALDRFFFGDTLRDLKNKNGIQIVKDDIRFFDKELLKGVDVVINLASISNDPASELNPQITKEINCTGALRLASLAKEMKVKRYIFSSSCSVYGAGNGVVNEESPVFPISEYAKSKQKAEQELIKLASPRFSVTIMRTATVYGLSRKRMRFDLIINIMTLHAWKNKKIFIRGEGDQWRPLIHIMDYIAGIDLLIEEKSIAKINKQIFNAGSNEQNYQVFQVANVFKKYFPDIHLEKVIDDPDNRSYHVNFDKISKALGFKPKKIIDDGILEIRDALEKGEVTDAGTLTHTLRHYQYLIEADRILSEVKLNNTLF